MRALFQFINKFSLIQQICVGLLIGIGFAVWAPETAVKLSLLGTIFAFRKTETEKTTKGLSLFLPE